MKSERDAWIFLNNIPELRPIHFHRLLHAARSAQGILELPVSGLQAAEVPREVAEGWYRTFRDPHHLRWLDAELDRLCKGVCKVVTELEEEYPAPLRELLDRPPVLYYKGSWPQGENAVGVVGTRHPSEYGRSVAERLATDLSVQGFTVVSGLAQGIDTCAHQAALNARGLTIAVLGCGLGRVFPPSNADLQERIAETGVVVSEFPYEWPPDSAHFPRRNRIISGLSMGVVVVEANWRSGALITARYAAEQGRDVFAVPGRVVDPTSAGCHRLIQQGATLVQNAGDILEGLGVVKAQEAAPAPQPTPHFDTLSPLEKLIVELLSEQDLSADELSQKSSQRFEQIAGTLLAMELKGIVRALPGQRYAKNN